MLERTESGVALAGIGGFAGASHVNDEAGEGEIFDDIDEPAGERAVAEATARARDFAERYGTLYPKAVACLSDDFASLTVHLRFPRQHWKRIRHSNFIERTFGETRRRTKVIGRLPGETSCLTLVWAVLDGASRGWRGLTMTSDGLRLLQDLRRSLLDPPRQLRPRTVTATQDDDRSENVSATA